MAISGVYALKFVPEKCFMGIMFGITPDDVQISAETNSISINFLNYDEPIMLIEPAPIVYVDGELNCEITNWQNMSVIDNQGTASLLFTNCSNLVKEDNIHLQFKIHYVRADQDLMYSKLATGECTLPVRAQPSLSHSTKNALVSFLIILIVITVVVIYIKKKKKTF